MDGILGALPSAVLHRFGVIRLTFLPLKCNHTALLFVNITLFCIFNMYKLVSGEPVHDAVSKEVCPSQRG